MEEFAVIVAGGSGSRMNSKLPKQFIEIGGLPVLMHTINQFIRYSGNINIILVLPESQIESWHLLCLKHNYSPSNISLVKGGETRFQSCNNGIQAIKSDKATVAIHDGVRPFASTDLIKKGFELAKKKGTAVACVLSKDSARIIDPIKNTNSVLERSLVRLIQTPQIFQLNILKKAYSQSEKAIFTDDASVVEEAGFEINLFDGDYKNIKITTIDDLALAEIYLANEGALN
jgi:2-C-methyl-D-erythritol 4-phosphate cytidylyltransferase